MTKTLARFTHLNDWLSWLENIHPCEIDLGLTRIREVATRMGIYSKPSNKAPIVTVAGTNGKGSCVSTLQQLLCASNLRVGSYTSPHILCYNERIQINGLNVSDDIICNAFAHIDMARQDGDLISLTYFEFSTLAALKIFEDQQVDVWLLEVGLGGRLDAVNIMDADLAVITSIALDHEHWLGDTRDLIAIEKAGIIRSGATVICADYEPPQSLQKIINNKAKNNYYIGCDFDLHFNVSDSAAGRLTIGGAEVHMNSRPNLPLPSVAAAAQVYWLLTSNHKELNLPKNHKKSLDFLAAELSSVTLHGRFERYHAAGIPIIFDVAHNPAAGNFLAERLMIEKFDDERFDDVQYQPSKLSCFTAMMSDKNIKDTIRPLLPFIDTWFCSQLEGFKRSEACDSLAKTVNQLLKQRVTINNNGCEDSILVNKRILRDANFEQLLLQSVSYAKKNQQTLLIFGSFYTVSQAKNILLRGLDK